MDDPRLAEIFMCACRAFHLMAEIGAENHSGTPQAIDQAKPRRRYLNATEAAEHCGCSRSTICRAADRGRLPIARAKLDGPGNEFLFDDVEKFRIEHCT